MAAVLATPSIANAQVLPSATARIVEWNCPLTGSQVQTPPPDPGPGALVTDGNFVWFVTRLGQPPLVRFTPGSLGETAAGACNWWDLKLGSVQFGGLHGRQRHCHEPADHRPVVLRQ